MNKELQFIQIIKNSLTDNSFLGDDCAYLKDLNLCVSSDSLVEDIHFSFSTTNPTLLAKKALKVNVSDILASGALPKYATVCLSGKLNENFIKEFYTSINDCANEFGLKIIGGDLTGGEKLTISICAFGDTKNRNISSRKNAQNGYVVALCGEFGTSAYGLKLLNKNPDDKSPEAEIHLEPLLNSEVANLIATKAKQKYAMMDSSDGLVNALEWISSKSNVGFEIEYDKIPKRAKVSKSQVLFGGEDYSLVCVLSEQDYKNINHPDLIKVGKAVSNIGIKIDGIDVKTMNREEFLHFD